MDHNESDLDGSMQSNLEDDLNDDLEYYGSENDIDENVHLDRAKMEDALDTSRLARLKKPEDIQSNIHKHNNRLQEITAAVERQAQAITTAAGIMSTPMSMSSLTPPPSVFPVPFTHLQTGNNPMATTSPLSTGSKSSSPAITIPSSTSNGGQSSELDPSKCTYEEQFKQLYELSNDLKRKEFLDDLFQFMTKRGTPVNRIPIMAKQVLDIYELYRLVVARGGLVEVINKKIWREITKGLNLPSSITSAAFTLRTQYMKYLYPYECEKEKLSVPEELQAAIDGNRREGRRSSYSQYVDMVGTTRNSPHHHYHQHRSPAHHHSTPLSLVSRQVNGYGSIQGLSSEEDSTKIPSTSARLAFPQQEALNLEVPRVSSPSTRTIDTASRKTVEVPEAPPAKRLLREEERHLNHGTLPSTHLKITSRDDGRSHLENSMVVSMEINGVMYQGVLFANNHRRRL